MNPSTWVSHNSLRIYGTSSSELVSAHTSQATEFLLKFYYNGNWINPTSLFIFILCGVCTTFIWPVFFFLTLPACPLAVKRLPLSINVSCNVTNPGFTLSFMDFMSVFWGGGGVEKKVWWAVCEFQQPARYLSSPSGCDTTRRKVPPTSREFCV